MVFLDIRHNTSLTNVNMSCTKWGVVTTIFNPTTAIVRLSRSLSWCVVIVPDLKTPTNYMEMLHAMLSANNSGSNNTHAMSTNYHSRVFYFSIEKQKKWQNAAGPLGSFAKSIPWEHFSRKNLGYLYAIVHGAHFIFDFDDDNQIKVDENGFPLEFLPECDDISQMKLANVSVVVQGASAFNHHPIMGASISNSWARGFPLDLLQDRSTQGDIAYQTDIPFVGKKKEIGVIQYLADGDPDVDAIHRLTKPLPMSFNNKGTPMLVPAHAYSPYNAQATVHAKHAFWAMLLPSTVAGRVSDIWRSYFSQCIFADIGLRVVFAPPTIEQIRNEHTYLGDFQAELPLYKKAGPLIDFLTKWDSSSNTLPDRIQDLWIDLYEYGYIEMQDISLVQEWLGALIQVGYEFPPLKRRHRNVALMGQFNYADKPSIVRDVIFWAQKARETFCEVVAAGPFSNFQIATLNQNLIKTISTAVTRDGIGGRKGYFSPLDNLKRTLLLYRNSSKIQGVLYVHDDGLMNVTELTQGTYPFPSSHILLTPSFVGKEPQNESVQLGCPQCLRASSDRERFGRSKLPHVQRWTCRNH